jgi:DNA adenine methylase
MRPPFAYFGGKAGMASRIAALLPAHRVYLEPFAGSLAVLFAKAPSPCEIVNDLDDAVVNFFRVLRDRCDELVEACELTPYARAEFAAAHLDGADVDDLERARRFWVRVNQSFAKTTGTATGWSRTTGRSQSPPASVAGRLDRFRTLADRLRSVMIEHCDGIDLIRTMATADTVVYADPPYLASTRAGHAAPADYRHELDVVDHRRLAAVLHVTPAAVVLSGYPSALYDELYRDWWSVDVAVTARSSNAARSGTRAGRVERLWCNRPPATLWDHALEDVGGIDGTS